MLVEILGIIAPAATATNPAINAYSMRSWAWSSIQNVDNTCFMRSPSRAQRWPDVLTVTVADSKANRQENLDWRSKRAHGIGSVAGCVGQQRFDLVEQRHQRGRYVRHQSSAGDGHQTCHQCILDDVLALVSLAEGPKQSLHPLSFARTAWPDSTKLTAHGRRQN